MEEETQLLFFDTFANDGTEGPNLGLVQFPNPIFIQEIRVIPLGARVEADFPGGVRLGATNPSKFQIDFFINDLTKQDACAFYDLGSFVYEQNVNIEFVPKEKIPTDGLIIKGTYSTLTLAVIGALADINSIIAKEPTPTTTPEPIIEPSNADSQQEDSMQTEMSNILGSEIEEIKEVMKELGEMSVIRESIKAESIKSESPLITTKNDKTSRASSLSSDGRSRGERRRIEDDRSMKSHHYSREKVYKRRHSRSPLSPRLKSRSRSSTPHLRRNHSKHSSPIDRSPKRYHRRSKSPKRRRSSRSLTPLSPYRNKKTNSSRSSPSSESLSRNRYNSPRVSRSHSRSPLALPKEVSKESKSENKEPIQSTKDNFESNIEKLYDSVSPENSLSDLAEKISDDENFDDIIEAETENLTPKKDALEEISSEEEYEDDGAIGDNDLLLDYADYDMNDLSYISSFNPYQCELNDLKKIEDPSLFHYEMIETKDDCEKISQLVNNLKQHEINDKWVEGLEHLAIEIQNNLIDGKDYAKSIIDLIIDGLDFEKALKQQLTAYKVRHLKAGIKLFTSLAHTNDQIIELMAENNLPQLLIDLYYKPTMTLPVRMLILKGIDAFSDTIFGVDHLTKLIYEWTKEDGQINSQTCYQKLLDLLLDKPSTRIVVALTSLLRKIHFFEALGHLKKSIETQKEVNENEIDSIYYCLSEIINLLRNGQSLIGQRSRNLPASSHFSIKNNIPFSYHSIYKYLKHFNIIECLTNIIIRQDSFTQDSIEISLELLNQFANSHYGLSFLLGKQIVGQTNHFIKTLIQHCDEPIQLIGMKLAYRLHVLQLIDSLFDYGLPQIEKVKTLSQDFIKQKYDDPEIAAIFHQLYSLMFSFIGKESLLAILSQDNHFDVILSYIVSTGDQEKDSFWYKLVCTNYAIELCVFVIQFNENNMTFLENYGQHLLKLSETVNIPKLKSLTNWLSPIKNCQLNSYSETSFKNLMGIIKKQADLASELNENDSFIIVPELIMTMRILYQLCLNGELNCETEFQLKYNYAVIEIFSFDGFNHLIKILSKLTDTYLKPSHQANELIGNKGILVISLMKLIIGLIKMILNLLITTRANEFKDVSPVPVLLRVSLLMTLFPAQSYLHNSPQQLQLEVSEILKFYTELFLNGNENEESFSKSAWTKMFQEVINFILSSPISFIHGLEIFSDLLPQPLPLIVKEPLTQDEIIKAINFRKLWSAHLHLMIEDVEKIILTLANSNYQFVQILLRRICIQLADLSAPSALTIAKFILESIHDLLDNFKENDAFSKQFMKFFNLLFDISSYHPLKLAFVSNIQSGNKKEDKCFQLFSKLTNILNKTTEEKNKQIIRKIFSRLNDVESFSGAEFNLNFLTSDSYAIQNEKLNNYFTNRQIYSQNLLDEEKEHFSFTFDESDSIESLKIDLLDLSKQFLGNDIDFYSILEKMCRPQDLSEQQTLVKAKEEIEKKKLAPLIRSAGKDLNLMNKRLVQRGRGRSFIRSNDPFRSRPPNTSRPPSMHVDDFIAMENGDQNSKRTNKDFSRLKGMNSQNNPMQRPIGSTIRPPGSYYSDNYFDVRRDQPSASRYSQRDQNGRSNRINPNWSKINSNKYGNYSRSFIR